MLRKSTKRIIQVLSFAILALTNLLLPFEHNSHLAQAQILTGPVASAMGGAGRAGIEAPERVFLNPAVAVFASGFEADLFYQDGYLGRGDHQSNYALSLVETGEGLIAAGGFAYVQRRRTIGGLMAVDEKFYQGTLARRLWPELSLGGSILFGTQSVQGGRGFEHWNGSVGLLYTPSSQFGVSYVVAHVVKAPHEIPEALHLVPQQSLGLHYLLPALARLVFDVTRWEKQNPDKKGILQAGAEFMTAPFLLYRMGFSLDDINKRNALTGGIGFDGPRLKVNYSLVKPLRGTNGAMHSVDLRVPF